ncbi:glycosyltransferase family 2 protein [Paenibacillus sp. Aloe-11]|uniref:glycosyltransferase family 2 protein n=1 Tax=Paenibacillus sp. Aloe-11 TaxID=1050222 RepID=UPI00024EF651|nr:glycosyltransferase family 2 protein [Paenibacillus sp. Aloe-11]EHS56265.1 glycosyltransferase [Paenibacillus sp. Aloe-11]
MSMTSIIIPTYNGLHLLKPCIEAIRTHTVDVPYEIIVVDNASNDGTDAFCAAERLISVRLPENRGFPTACNMGFRLASGDQLVILNNDVTVTRGWLSNMLAALQSESTVGLVGPVTNYVSGIQQIHGLAGDFASWMRFAEQNNTSNPSRWQEVKRLVGFCMLFRHELVERIGLLDERFSPGHYEDDDYCLRARVHGYKLLMCNDCFVYHQGNASFSRENTSWNEELIERNYRLFIEKWSIDPRMFIETGNVEGLHAEHAVEGGGKI